MRFKFCSYACFKMLKYKMPKSSWLRDKKFYDFIKVKIREEMLIFRKVTSVYVKIWKLSFTFLNSDFRELSLS